MLSPPRKKLSTVILRAENLSLIEPESSLPRILDPRIKLRAVADVAGLNFKSRR